MTTKQLIGWKIQGVRSQLKALNIVNRRGTFGHGRIDRSDKDAKRAALTQELRRLELEMEAA